MGAFMASYETSHHHISYDHLTSLFDGIDEVVYVSDPETCEVLYANNSLKALFGSSVVGAQCHKVLQGIDSPRKSGPATIIDGTGR